ncbi:DNA modification system-associated small protein [Desulfovibrio fairfieldensis]|mgnify:CR=1 FL=1|uniref:Uncharacterized protein n=1 Tax=Desulfovibrio fairfieldensis TaxID=44742 RepID=A0A109W532_9BACT|nr:DNA modification system-associated small protein [Desulfovibrio fairfieldensis]AMD91370.1 hypothetical protein AXF13_15205 [Desulfovibrio fairfieldensis]
MSEIYLRDLPLWTNDSARAILEKICAEMNVPIDVLTELVVLQRERQHQERAAGIYPRFEEILGRMD